MVFAQSRDIGSFPPEGGLKIRLSSMRRMLTALLSLVLITSACGNGDSGAANGQSSKTDAPVSTEANSEETAAPTTINTTTTTVNPATEADLTVLITISAIESTRSDLISAIEEDFVLDRVDVFETKVESGPPGSAIIYISGTSGYSTDEFQIQKAWELATTMATFWQDDDVSLRNDQGNLKPGLEIVVDGRRFMADHDLMVRVAERRVTQDEWLMLARG